ncbi:MAG: hypothetical protein VKL39_03800 [Leptolyngbyaceae bacterium]|nr:hypothetical protein [Leptolyngbyaceae bacterium]
MFSPSDWCLLCNESADEGRSPPMRLLDTPVDHTIALPPCSAQIQSGSVFESLGRSHIIGYTVRGDAVERGDRQG